ncbi:MAG: DUF1802 family protein [Planctomycetes bacterium]|jgi:hypothetical protein|nr:DUF1802 family protein [Planctomycetota bacterium]
MIDVALKEWQLVCDLLVGGEMCLLVRKGGIHEAGGPGAFHMSHDRFALYPTFDHQDATRVKPAYRPRLAMEPDARRVAVRGWARTARIWPVPSRDAFDRLGDLHPWAPPYIDMRFDYRPDRPLYLVAVRAYGLPAPRPIRYRAAFAGCRSWVPLQGDDVIDQAGSTPAMDEPALDRIIQRIDAAFAGER